MSLTKQTIAYSNPTASCLSPRLKSTEKNLGETEVFHAVRRGFAEVKLQIKTAIRPRQNRGKWSHSFERYCISTDTLRAESPSIFLDKSGRGRRLCVRLQDSLIRRSSEKMDESVQFPVGQTSFLLTHMIIRLSGFSKAIRMHKCRDHANCTRTNKLSLHIFSWGYGLNNAKPIKAITFNLTKIIRFIRSLSLVQFVTPRQIHAEIIYLRVDLLDLRVIHACEWPLRNLTHLSSVINIKEYLMQLCLVS